MPASSSEITVRFADWREHAPVLQAIRREVFVVEQRVPEQDEWDEMDTVCHHALARINGKAAGTGRLLPDGKIGRMAVLKSWRRRGVGSTILQALLTKARELQFSQVHLHAQTHAVAFYSKHGFIAQGDEFIEAGIPHYQMRLLLMPPA